MSVRRPQNEKNLHSLYEWLYRVRVRGKYTMKHDKTTVMKEIVGNCR